MKLYHGSSSRVRKPNLGKCRTNTDFGKGFYTTTSLEQARKWAEIIKKRQNIDIAYVSIYEVDDNVLDKDYIIHHFPAPSKEWLDFVVNNRNERIDINYDIVKGPVADDTVYEVLPLYESGRISADVAISMLKPEKLFDQFSFHTIDALRELTFTSSIEVS